MSRGNHPTAGIWGLPSHPGTGPNPSPCPFHTAATHGLSLQPLRGLVSGHHLHRGLTELPPQLVTKPFPVGSVAPHHPPALPGWEEHHHPPVPAPGTAAPGAEGRA